MKKLVTMSDAGRDGKIPNLNSTQVLRPSKTARSTSNTRPRLHGLSREAWASLRIPPVFTHSHNSRLLRAVGMPFERPVSWKCAKTSIKKQEAVPNHRHASDRPAPFVSIPLREECAHSACTARHGKLSYGL